MVATAWNGRSNSTSYELRVGVDADHCASAPSGKNEPFDRDGSGEADGLVLNDHWQPPQVKVRPVMERWRPGSLERINRRPQQGSLRRRNWLSWQRS